MRLLNIDMEYIKDAFLAVGVILLTWFTETFYVFSIDTVLISIPNLLGVIALSKIHNYMLGIKDVMSFTITSLVLVITLLKLKKELKKKK